MRRLLLLVLAVGCAGREEDPVVVDTDLVEEISDPDCGEVEGAFVAADLDVEALDRDAAEDLGDTRFTIELYPDGTFASVLADDGEAFVHEGSWQIVDGELVIDPFLPGIEGTTTLECRLEDGRLSVYGFTTYTFDDEPVEAQFLGELAQLP